MCEAQLRSCGSTLLVFNKEVYETTKKQSDQGLLEKINLSTEYDTYN